MMESPFRKAAHVEPHTDEPPSEVRVSESGQLVVVYSPGDKSFTATVIAAVSDGKITSAWLQLSGATGSLSREQWETLKAIGDRVWAEFDKAVRQRKERA